jgi:ABC-type multidrug transport system ATPase subunit
VNGIPVDNVRDWYIANTGYVLQLATPYYEELTVRENLTLAAQMRLANTLELQEKFDRVEKVMKEVRDPKWEGGNEMQGHGHFYSN